MRSQLDRLLEVGRRRAHSRSFSNDEDDVFSQDVEVNGNHVDDDDDAKTIDGSTWSLGSDQPSSDSATPYEARYDLRASNAARLCVSQTNFERPSTKVEATRDRRQQVNRVSSLKNDDEQTYTNPQKRMVRRCTTSVMVYLDYSAWR